MIKTYTELIRLPTFKERFDYLYVGGQVGAKTFGNERYLNQVFYKSEEWKAVRRAVILRDNACDLGIEGREIQNSRLVRIHHLNPITIEDIRNHSPKLTDPENLITCLNKTHQAIHYTGWDGVLQEPVERAPNDTCPWR
jgi:hypothetical protein